jgi:SAM-dependent methyltransferase
VGSLLTPERLRDLALGSHPLPVQVSDEAFVDDAYRLLLRRDADEDWRRSALARLAAGDVSRATLISELATSPEFARLRALDDGIALAARARARSERPRLLEAPPVCDERAVEIAWVLARYRAEPRVLDVGYANAERAYLDALVAACPAQPVGVDLVDGDVPGMRGVIGDVRRLPFEDGSFDVAFCISTLEHVGADNRVYGVEDGGAGGMEEALAELRRVLGRRGRLLVTVPCGLDEDHGWFVQRTPSAWSDLFQGAGFLVFEAEAYEHGAGGWRSGEGAEARYGEHAGAVLCAELHPATLGARMRHAARR